MHDSKWENTIKVEIPNFNGNLTPNEFVDK